jgi:hypothetical protein
MAAVFVSGSTDIFQNNSGGASGLITIPAVDGLVKGITVYDSVSVQMGETLQFFLTFDDVTKFIHFGQAIGSVQAQGTMYSDCNGQIPSASQFSGAYNSLKGSAVSISIGGTTVKAVLNSAQLTVVNEQDIMAHFSFNFSIVQNS